MSATTAPLVIGASGAPFEAYVPANLQPWDFYEPPDGSPPPLFHLDFETYNELNLKQVGLYRYAAHPSLELLLMAWQHVGSPSVGNVAPFPAVSQTESEQEMLDILADAARDRTTVFAAFNAAFERAVLAAKGLDIPPERWICVQAWAYSMAFNGGLREVGEQLGIPTDQQKLKSGTRLITKFCAPRKPTKNNPATRWTSETAPEDWQEFRHYNRMDVTSEVAISHKLMPYFPNRVQRAEYCWDDHVNNTGLPIDRKLVDACCAVYEADQKALKARMQELTGLANPASQPQLLGWLQDQGLPITNLQKATIRDALAMATPGTVLHEVLRLRSLYSRSSPKKWLALQRATGEDDRLRGTFQLWGAGRTQRWAGRIFQPQNLPWPSTELEGLPELMYTRDREVIETIHPSTSDALVSLIRNAVTAPEGYMLGVADLSSIESVVIGYLSGCHRINSVFAEGRDIYKDFGAALYGKPESEVTKAERQLCKPPALGCGYGLSPKGLMKYGAGMGVEIEEEQAKQLVNLYRTTYPEVPAMWYWLEDVLQMVTLATPNTKMYEGCGVRIWNDGEYVRIQKPSGWCLSYHKPRLEYNRWDRLCFTYMGKNQLTGKWERLYSRGSGITENIVQSVSRDLLMHGAWLAWEKGLNVIGHVHDELIIMMLKALAEKHLALLLECLTTKPLWAPGIHLGAEGKVVFRYEK